jgi:hypothetical protein
MIILVIIGTQRFCEMKYIIQAMFPAAFSAVVGANNPRGFRVFISFLSCE